jgi:hypothetical protein
MQEITIYVSAANSLGVIRDYANAQKMTAPSLMRGCEYLLRLRLFANTEGDVSYPLSTLQQVKSWEFVMDNDYDNTTTNLLVADNSEITVETVNDTSIDDETRSFTEVKIPLSKTNTEQLAEYLGTDRKKGNITAELVGYDSNGNDIFVLQIENFTFCNRLTSQGQPTVIDPEYLTATQINAIVADLQQQIDNINPKAGNVFISEGAEHYAGTDVENAIIDLQNQINDMPTGGGGSGSVEASKVLMSQTAGQYAGDNVQNAIVDLAEICNGLIEQVESINLALAAAETELERI